MDLTEAEDVKKRWQEYTEELYKEGHHDPENHDGVITGARHPEMQSQVGLRKHHYEQSEWRWWNSNWAISNPKRLCCESAVLNMPANLENSAVATGLEKVSFHSNPKVSQCQRTFKLLHNSTHLHTNKLMLKILQARLNSTWIVNFQMLKLDLEKAEQPEIKWPTSFGS